MKRKASKLTLVMALLFSSAVGALTVNLVKANPAPLFSFPTEPITTPPIIVVNLPVQNQTCNTTVGLSLTIIKPETWFAIDVGHHSDGSPINQTFVNITSVYYVIDDGERQNITVHDVTSLWDTTPTLTLNLSIPLSLAVGTHTLKAGLEADSYYVIRYTYNFSDALSSVKLHAEAVPVNFRVATDLEIQLESFPIIPIVASLATVSVVSLSSLVYFKKHEH